MEDNNIKLFDNLALAGIMPEDLVIQTYTDSDPKPAIDYMASNFNYDASRVKKLNADGAGIFWCINPQVEKNKRAWKKTSKLVVFGLDLDVAKEKSKEEKVKIAEDKKKMLDILNSLPYQPTGILESKNGYQPYWIFDNALDLKTEAEREIGRSYYLKLRDGFEKKTGLKSEGDGICRVLRFPSTLHQKTKNDPFTINEAGGSGNLVDFKAFVGEYMEEEAVVKPAEPKFKEVKNLESIYDFPVKEALEKLSGTEIVDEEKYTFKKNSNGSYQVIINGAAHSCWIDVENNTIGSRSGGSPVNIVNWVKYYHPDWHDDYIRAELDKLLLEKKTPDASFEFVTMKEIYGMTFPKESWLIEKILLSTGFNLLVGEGGSGKSYLALAMAKALVSKEKFLGKFEIKSDANILFLDKENGLRRFQKRLKALDCPMSTNLYWLKYPERFSLKDDGSIQKVKTFIEEKNIKLVIVDSYVDILIGKENSSEDTSETFNQLRKISDSVSWLLICHSSKPGAFERTISQKTRGSGNIVNQSDSGFFMTKEQGSDNLYTIEQSKSRDYELLKKFQIKFISSADFEGVAEVLYAGEPEDELKTLENAKTIIFEAIGDKANAVCFDDLKNMQLGIGESNVRRSLRILEDQKILKVFTGVKGKKYFYREEIENEN